MQSECPEFAIRRTPRHVSAWRFLAVAAFSYLTLFGGLACQKPKAVGPGAKPFAGRTVTVATPEDRILRELLQRQGGSWAERHGASFVLTESGSPSADLRVFAPYELPEVLGRGRLQALPTDRLNASEFDFGSVLRHYRHRLSEWQTRVFAVPIVGDAYVGVYRTDLLDAPVHRQAINRKLKLPLRADGPLTWQEVLVIAEHFSETPQWADGSSQQAPRPSLPPLPADASGLDREFHSVAASFSRRATTQAQLDLLGEDEKYRRLYDYQFDARTGAARVHTAGFVAALAFLQRVHKYRPASAAEQPADSFRAGQAVFAVVPLAQVANLQAADSPVRNKFSVCRPPGTDHVFDTAAPAGTPVTESDGNFVPYLGASGWMIGLSESIQEKDAALDFLFTLAGPQMCLEIAFEPAWGAGPTRSLQFELGHRSGWHTYGLNAARTNKLVEVLERTNNPTIINPAFRLRIPREHEHLKIFVDTIRAALEKGTAPTDALQAVANRWEALNPDAKSRTEQYRRSLGLE